MVDLNRLPVQAFPAHLADCHKPVIPGSVFYATRKGLWSSSGDKAFSFRSGGDWDVDIHVFPRSVPMFVNRGSGRKREWETVCYGHRLYRTHHILVSEFETPPITFEALQRFESHANVVTPRSGVLPMCTEVGNIVAALNVCEIEVFPARPRNVHKTEWRKQKHHRPEVTPERAHLLAPWIPESVTEMYVEHRDGNAVKAVCGSPNYWTLINYGTS